MKKNLSSLTLEQLTTLVMASKDNIDITDLCDSRFSLKHLDLLIREKYFGTDVSLINNPLIPYNNLELLVEAMDKGTILPEFANPLLDEDKLMLLIEANNAGIDVRGLANPYIELEMLKELVDLRAKGKDENIADIRFLTPHQVELFVNYLNTGFESDNVSQLYRENVIKYLGELIDKKEVEKTIDIVGEKVTEKVPSRTKVYKIYKQNTSKKNK